MKVKCIHFNSLEVLATTKNTKTAKYFWFILVVRRDSYNAHGIQVYRVFQIAYPLLVNQKNTIRDTKHIKLMRDLPQKFNL